MIRRHRGARLLHMVRSPYGRPIQGACTITIGRGRTLALGATLSLASFRVCTEGDEGDLVHFGPVAHRYFIVFRIAADASPTATKVRPL